MEKLHIPVLLSEVMAGLKPKQGESYLDLTAGYGGHAKEILDVTQNYKDSVLVDRDEFAAKYLEREFPLEISIKNTDFYNAVLQLFKCGKTFDIILADFGVSSPQLSFPTINTSESGKDITLISFSKSFIFSFSSPINIVPDKLIVQNKPICNIY